MSELVIIELIRLFGKLSWPIFAIVVILFFKKYLIELIYRLTKIKKGDAEFSFVKTKRDLIYEIVENKLLGKPKVKQSFNEGELGALKKDIYRDIENIISFNQTEINIIEYLMKVSNQIAEKNDIFIYFGFRNYNQFAQSLMKLQKEDVIKIKKDNNKEIVSLEMKFIKNKI